MSSVSPTTSNHSSIILNIFYTGYVQVHSMDDFGTELTSDNEAAKTAKKKKRRWNLFLLTSMWPYTSMDTPTPQTHPRSGGVWIVEIAGTSLDCIIWLFFFSLFLTLMQTSLVSAKVEPKVTPHSASSWSWNINSQLGMMPTKAVLLSPPNKSGSTNPGLTYGAGNMTTPFPRPINQGW